MQRRAGAGLRVGVALLAVTGLAACTGGPPAGPSRSVISPGGLAATALARDSLRDLPSGQPIYFVMTDRFANADPGNDRGGASGGRLVTGFDPTDPGFFHGGDLAGLTERLDYIAGLGAQAIWITPIVRNEPVAGSGAQASAGYHGYWGLDFTSVDPHLGSAAEAAGFVAAAHARGLKVYLDVVVNHTADLIRYADGSQDYISRASRPYLSATGAPFDDRAVADTTRFPALNLASFPHVPVLRNPADATAKRPAWLNDLTVYHNRGTSTYTGEDTQYGDIAGLDDLFTEDPRVLRGMTDVVNSWVDALRVDGLRLDTVKHVNPQFWAAFIPAVRGHARQLGISPFYVFGEVFDSDALNTSPWVKAAGVPALLDFPFQAAAVKFAAGGSPQLLADLFDRDDLYTDADSNAYSLATFLGNHDIGRVAMFLRQDTYGEDAATLLRRDLLAHDLLFFARGNPVVYYGDEQGLVGTGGDKAARQDMFATRVAEYADQPTLTGRPGGADHFDRTSPLYTHIAALARFTAGHPALRIGAQVTRLAQDPQGVFAFSRMSASEGVEYVVALNSSLRPQTVRIPTYSSGMAFSQVWPVSATGTVSSGADRSITVTVPALSSMVWRAQAPLAAPGLAPSVRLVAPGAASVGGGMLDLTAQVSSTGFAQVTFAWRPAGRADAGGWTVLGTDDNPPYRVSVDLSATGQLAGTTMQVRAVVKLGTGPSAGPSAGPSVGRAPDSAVASADASVLLR